MFPDKRTKGKKRNIVPVIMDLLLYVMGVAADPPTDPRPT